MKKWMLLLGMIVLSSCNYLRKDTLSGLVPQNVSAVSVLKNGSAEAPSTVFSNVYSEYCPYETAQFAYSFTFPEPVSFTQAILVEKGRQPDLKQHYGLSEQKINPPRDGNQAGKVVLDSKKLQSSGSGLNPYPVLELYVRAMPVRGKDWSAFSKANFGGSGNEAIFYADARACL